MSQLNEGNEVGLAKLSGGYLKIRIHDNQTIYVHLSMTQNIADCCNMNCIFKTTSTNG